MIAIIKIYKYENTANLCISCVLFRCIERDAEQTEIFFINKYSCRVNKLHIIQTNKDKKTIRRKQHSKLFRLP